MGTRTFYDPETEVPVLVTECPLEKAGGGVSPRLKVWAFSNAENGLPIVELTVHRTDRLSRLTEPELEFVYLNALANL